MTYITRQEATQRIAALLDAMQSLHAEARALSDEFEVPFEITLEGGANYDTTAEYSQWAPSTWNSSNC